MGFGLSCILLSVLLVSTCLPSQAQLSANFYDSTCPNVLATTRNGIRRAVSRERKMVASLIRLHFHDCFVQGCDASILLDDTPRMIGEKFSRSNNQSVRGYEVIDAVKADVESQCPGIVSCADIVAVAARDASVAVGGPSWTVNLGRRDSTTASDRVETDNNLPFSTDSLNTMISLFDRKGLNSRDLVALSGAHTIGQARCVTFRNRIHSNASDIEASFATTRRRGCPAQPGNGNGNLAPLDIVTPDSFDNNYFRLLVQRRGLLQSDQVLFSGGSTDSVVNEYSRNPSFCSSECAAAMVKMRNIEPLTESQGVIRRLCYVAS